jgi:hypothetical protein
MPGMMDHRFRLTCGALIRPKDNWRIRGDVAVCERNSWSVLGAELTDGQGDGIGHAG